MFAPEATLPPSPAAPRTRANRDGLARRTLANSARQTVLRRVAPALKHDMVVHLQAVSMMAELLSSRIERGSLGADEMPAKLSKINRLAREAVTACLKVTSWIEAPDDECVPLHEGIDECVRLLSASLNFRGFAIANGAAPTELEVHRNALRSLLAASLLGLADEAPEACELVVEAHVASGEAVVEIRSRSLLEQPVAPIPPASETGPRPAIDWPEVEALAAAANVTFTHAQGEVSMRLPRAVATSPLQMAPV